MGQDQIIEIPVIFLALFREYCNISIYITGRQFHNTLYKCSFAVFLTQCLKTSAIFQKRVSSEHRCSTLLKLDGKVPINRNLIFNYSVSTYTLHHFVLSLAAGPEAVTQDLIKVVLAPLATVGTSFQYPPVNWSAILSPLMRLNFGKPSHFLHWPF